jgi:asparagine N-glycosylation enzyme membrane subunit Stt3
MGTEATRPAYGPTFWIGLALGGSLMTFAVWGAASAFSVDEQIGLARWLAGSAVVHDAVLAPIVTLVGIGLALVLPRAVRGPALAALVISGVVVLFTWPALRGYGRREANPTILPHDYSRNVGVVLALVWGTAAAVAVGRAVRDRRR